MTSYLDTRPEQRPQRTRTAVFRISAILVAFAALGLATGWYFYGNMIEPRQTVGDPTKKIGTGDGVSRNPATIDALDKPAEGNNP